MTRRASICPTCRRPFAPKLTVTGPVRQRIVNLIADRPDGISRDELWDLVYSSAPDAPNDRRAISTLVHLADKQLAAQGFHIEPAWLGRGARYRLITTPKWKELQQKGAKQMLKEITDDTAVMDEIASAIRTLLNFKNEHIPLNKDALYIGGPMSGRPALNAPAFDVAATLSEPGSRRQAHDCKAPQARCTRLARLGADRQSDRRRALS